MCMHVQKFMWIHACMHASVYVCIKIRDGNATDKCLAYTLNTIDMQTLELNFANNYICIMYIMPSAS